MSIMVLIPGFYYLSFEKGGGLLKILTTKPFQVGCPLSFGKSPEIRTLNIKDRVVVDNLSSWLTPFIRSKEQYND
jgi:hypothetical protein